MAFRISRRTNRASSSGKSLSDLYEQGRKEDPSDQPLDRLRQEIFVEMARHARAQKRRRARRVLLDALWVTIALTVALGVSAHYLDVATGVLLPLGRPLPSRPVARIDTPDRDRAPERQQSEPSGGGMPGRIQSAAPEEPVRGDLDGETVGRAAEPGPSLNRPAADLRSEPARLAEEAAELQELLQSWITTLNARNVDRLKGFYAPTMSAFYRARNVSREFVLADKADQFRRAKVLYVGADAAEISLPPDGRSAAVTFRKRYEITGGGLNRVGEVVSELRWTKSPSGWVITSERDLEVP